MLVADFQTMTKTRRLSPARPNMIKSDLPLKFHPLESRRRSLVVSA
jgi:hypothetical protein